MKKFSIFEMVFILLLVTVLMIVLSTKLLKTQEKAQESVAKSFAATMTRTVGPSLYAYSLAHNNGGSIKEDGDGNDSTFFGRPITNFVTVPRYFDIESVDFSQCASKRGVSVKPFMRKSEKEGGEYNLFCLDGNLQESPRFAVSKEDRYVF